MRYLILAFLVIIPSFFYGGQELRVAQEAAFEFGGMALLLASMFFVNRGSLRNKVNLWLGIFALWILVAHMGSQFTMGRNYVFNVFIFMVIYLVSIRTLKKEDIPILFKGIIAVCIVNLLLMTSQALGWDPIFRLRGPGGISTWGTDTLGFFGLKAAMGMYFAIALPILAITSWWLAALFFVPIGVSVSSGALVGAVAGYFFYLWHIHRQKFWLALIPLVIGATVFIVKVDSPMGMFKTRPPAWKMMTRDAFKKPITGYGLDSIRFGPIRYFKEAYDSNVTHRALKQPDGKYYLNARQGTKFDWWDNPHNEYVQSLYEFGLPGLFILGMIVYSLIGRFRKATKTKTVVAMGAIGLAVLLMSATQFPFHLARIAHIFPILLAIFMLETEEA